MRVSEWGPRRRSAAVDGFALSYVRRGAGRPVLLLHGWPGFSYDWRRVLPRLARRADVVAPDLRGFGDSDGHEVEPLEAYTPDAQVRSLLGLLDELELPAVVVGGYDVGSRLAQTLARVAPERVRALVLSAPLYPGMGERRLSAPAQAEYWYQHFHRLPFADALIGRDRESVRIYLAHFYDHWVGRKDAVCPEEFEAVVDAYARPGALRSSIAWYRAGASAGVAANLDGGRTGAISQPTAVLWGALDPLFPPAWADRLGEFFPASSLQVLEGVGHFTPFEAPDAWLQAVERILAASAPGTK